MPDLKATPSNGGPPVTEPEDMQIVDPHPVLRRTDSEETLETLIIRLGRERPPIFPSITSEITFVFSVTMSQFLTEYFVSGFTVILPTVIHDLHIPQASSVWPATAFSLVIASTLLVFGRLGDMYGGRSIFVAGLIWLLGWSIVAGLSTSEIMLDLCRALQGLGAAAFLPTGVMLMGEIYRPGPRKNLVFAIYGTLGILGFFGGIFVAGIVGEFLRWGWYFWIGGMLAAVTLVAAIFAFFLMNKGDPRETEVKMDFLGAVTIVSGLTLTVFAITESAHAGLDWRQAPYVPATLAIGLLSLIGAFYVETHVSAYPLLPASFFAIESMTPLLFSLFLLYGTWGIFSVYGTLYFQKVMGASPLQIVAWYTPLGVAGLLVSILEGFIMHLVPGRILLIVSSLGALGSQLLIALIPIEGGSYWPWIFPATILSSIGIDLSTIIMTVFVTTKVPTAQQGLAGGVINSVLQLGVAFVLGVTDIVQSATVEKVGLARSYKNTFWFGVGAGALSLIVMGIWVNVPKATSELTAYERTQLLQESGRSRQSYGICQETGTDGFE